MLDRISQADFSALVGDIYDCAIDPDGWPKALLQVRNLVRCANASIQVNAMPMGRMLLNLAEGVEQPWLDRMTQYDADVAEIWGGTAAEASVDRPYLATQMYPSPDVLYTNRYFLEWAKPQGLVDAMALILARDSSTIAALGMGRHESAGPFDEDDLRYASLVLPHLQRSVAIGRLLEMTRVLRDDFVAALDLLTIPIFLVDSRLRLAHANEAASRLLGQGDPLALRHGVIEARSSIAAHSLSVSVRQAAVAEAEMGRKGLGIPLCLADGAIGAIHVLPLQSGTLRGGMVPGAVAALFVSGITPAPNPPTEIVRALFGLTPTEARVFEHIAAGLTREEAAARLEISLVTVKSHLLRLYDKLGVHRQADIARIAASLTVPIAPAFAATAD